MATIKHFPTNPHLGRFWYAHPDQQIVPRQCNRGALWSLSTEKESGIVVVAKSKQEVDEAQLAQQCFRHQKIRLESRHQQFLKEHNYVFLLTV